MTDKSICVGLIGLSAGIHWPVTAPIPALKTLPHEYIEVGVGVANTSLAGARREPQ